MIEHASREYALDLSVATSLTGEDYLTESTPLRYASAAAENGIDAICFTDIGTDAALDALREDIYTKETPFGIDVDTPREMRLFHRPSAHSLWAIRGAHLYAEQKGMIKVVGNAPLPPELFSERQETIEDVIRAVQQADPDALTLHSSPGNVLVHGLPRGQFSQLLVGDGIEVHSYNLFHMRQRFADRYEQPIIGTSNAKTPEDIGKGYTTLTLETLGPDQQLTPHIRDAVRTEPERLRPVVRRNLRGIQKHFLNPERVQIMLRNVLPI